MFEAPARFVLPYAPPPPRSAGWARRAWRTAGAVLLPVVVISSVTISLSTVSLLTAGWIALRLAAS